MKRERPRPPRPEQVRSPPGSFGWLDARLLHDGWLDRLGTERIAVLTLLAIAADRTGSSFYRRDTMAQALGMQRRNLDEALERLLELELVAHQPWSAASFDGVWQLLPLPARRPW